LHTRLADGWAEATNPAQPGELTVHLQGVPVAAPYWVLNLGPEAGPAGLYDYSVVSDPDLISLFVLTRNVSRFFQLYNATVYDNLLNYGFTNPLNHPLLTPQPANCNYPSQ
jgi:lipocalin